MKDREFFSEDAYLVGGIFSLTGYLSWLGVYKKKAAELKIRLINERGGINGKKLKLVYFDDRSSPEAATKLAERLILKDKVVAIVGTASVPISLAVARVANRYRVPCFVSSGYLIDPLRDIFVFNTAHRTEIAILKAFRLFRESGIKRLGLLMPYGSLGDVGSYLGRLIAQALKMKIVTEERFEIGTKELSDSVSRVISLRPQAIFSFVTGLPAFWVAKTLENMEINLPLLLSHGNASPKFFRYVRDLKSPIFVPSGKTMMVDWIPETDPSKNIILDFHRHHEACFGEPANYHSAELADSIDLICEALRTGAANPEEVKEAVEGVRNFTGMQGVYTFSRNDHYGTHPADIVLLKVENGKTGIQKVPSDDLLAEELSERKKDSLLTKITGVLLSDTFVPKEGRGQRIEEEINLLSSEEYLRLKKDLSEALSRVDEIKARSSLNEILIYIHRIDDQEVSRIVTLEVAFVLMDFPKRVGDEREMSQIRKDFFKKVLQVKDKSDFLKLLLELYNSVISYILNGLKSMDLISRLIFLLNGEAQENVTVKMIAKKAGFSPSYLSHRIKKEYGLTVKELIRRVKINNALGLLAFSDQSIGRIAHEVGFSDQSYFTKVFKKYTKMTPKAFRRDPERNFRRFKMVLQPALRKEPHS